MRRWRALHARHPDCHARSPARSHAARHPTIPRLLYLDQLRAPTHLVGRHPSQTIPRHLQRRGTLLFSVMNIAELSANRGASADDNRSFLEEVGSPLGAITVNPSKVVAEEVRLTHRDQV